LGLVGDALRRTTCVYFVASTPKELLWRVFDHANVNDNILLHDTVLEKLSLLKYTLNDDPHRNLYLAKDNKGHDIFCIKRLNDTFKSIVDVLTGSMMETTPPSSRLG
jgi:hypothetical protein